MAKKDETIRIDGGDGRITLHVSPKVAGAVKALRKGKGSVEGVKVTKILEAAYVEGRNDGAREMADAVDSALASTRTQLAAARPGRPAPKATKGSSAAKAASGSGGAKASKGGAKASKGAAKAARASSTKAVAGSTKAAARGGKASGRAKGKAKTG